MKQQPSGTSAQEGHVTVAISVKNVWPAGEVLASSERRPGGQGSLARSLGSPENRVMCWASPALGLLTCKEGHGTLDTSEKQLRHLTLRLALFLCVTCIDFK
ncbi:hypothetical protein E2C01_026133 [Portunus trituberculatus]|uniref:Uncharacterized protein n=1 Tax=Portunus trituberculatus TaxID=210409 RepID=A0A5B7EF88_PORTR|nr:hypothetical protein [Portunus trituberculatus]